MNPHFVDELDYEDESKITLERAVGKAKTFYYEYDFGDDWMHEIRFEKASNPEATVTHAVCTEGARACPPEDIGGPFGYEDFLAALADPDHEMHEELKEWIGGPFDPEAFSLAKINARLKRLK